MAFEHHNSLLYGAKILYLDRCDRTEETILNSFCDKMTEVEWRVFGRDKGIAVYLPVDIEVSDDSDSRESRLKFMGEALQVMSQVFEN
jgi:hypothetical protein